MHTSARSALIGSAVMVAIATSLALGRGPVPAHQFRDKPFDSTLHEDLATLAAASERIEALDKPKLVQTESILPIERDPLMTSLMLISAPSLVAEKINTVAAAPAPRRRVEPDVCQRHGLRKVMVDQYRWRCRK